MKPACGSRPRAFGNGAGQPCHQCAQCHARGGNLTLSAAAELVTAAEPYAAGLSPGAYLQLTVADTGTGLDEAVMACVTEPFFTTKALGKGTGLGLAMAKSVAEQSGHGLVIGSTPGLGTRVSLWLPRAGDQPAAAPLRAELADPAPWSPSVLLVDDDAIVPEALTASLEDAGFVVVAAESGAAALALLKMGDRIGIIISDLTMPAMNGASLTHAAQVMCPGLPAELLTGYAGDDAALPFGGAISGSFSLLRNPISGTKLAERIADLLQCRRTSSVG